MKKLIKAIAKIEVWAVTDELAGVDDWRAIRKTIEANPKNFEILSVDSVTTGQGVCDSCDDEFKEYRLEKFNSEYLCPACLADAQANERESKKYDLAESQMESIKNGDHL